MENNTVFEAGALAGRQQAFAMIASKCSYAQAVCLKEIHDTRAYEQAGLTWEEFCTQQAGISRGTAEPSTSMANRFPSGTAQKIRAGIRRLQAEVNRVHNHYRVPTRIVEYGVRLDDVLKAVSARARLGRALPQDELSGLRSLAHHVLDKWAEVVEMLKPDVTP